MPLDDAWMRDSGPTFVHDASGAVHGEDWVFNGWGQQDWARWERDARVAEQVCRLAGVPRVASDLVNEGGGTHVDGLGTCLVTTTVQHDPQRNPAWTRERRIEAELARTLGASHCVWLDRGLTRGALRFGTRGHVDIVATVAAPGSLLLHTQPNPAHPDHAVMREIRALLERTTDAAGLPW